MGRNVKNQNFAKMIANKLVDHCFHYPRLRGGVITHLRDPHRILNFHDFSLPSKERKCGFEGVIVINKKLVTPRKP